MAFIVRLNSKDTKSRHTLADIMVWLDDNHRFTIPIQKCREICNENGLSYFYLHKWSTRKPNGNHYFCDIVGNYQTILVPVGDHLCRLNDKLSDIAVNKKTGLFYRKMHTLFEVKLDAKRTPKKRKINVDLFCHESSSTDSEVADSCEEEKDGDTRVIPETPPPLDLSSDDDGEPASLHLQRPSKKVLELSSDMPANYWNVVTALRGEPELIRLWQRTCIQKVERLPTSAANLVILERYLKRRGYHSQVNDMYEYLQIITPSITDSPKKWMRSIAMYHLPLHVLKFVDDIIIRDRWMRAKRVKH